MAQPLIGMKFKHETLGLLEVIVINQNRTDIAYLQKVSSIESETRQKYEIKLNRNIDPLSTLQPVSIKTVNTHRIIAYN